MAKRDELKQRYEQVTQRVGEAAVRNGRSAEQVIVVAVTKTAGPDQIRRIIELGQRDLGENRVQQLEQRAAMTEEFTARRRSLSEASDTDAAVRWHMIGHLQRNKVRSILPLVRLTHSVDTLRLAEEIQVQASRADREADVLLQVNISGEEQKQGFAPPTVIHVAEQMQTMAYVRLRGLMTMAPYADDPEASRTWFLRCAEMFAELQSLGTLGPHFNILSMGMSNDFEVGIECGANVVRIGRALFGEAESE